MRIVMSGRFQPRGFRRQRGAALIELALIGTFLSLVILGTIDFGRIGYTAMALTNAARNGAMVGSLSVSNSSNFTAMTNAASASAVADIGTITASASRGCECESGGSTTVIACSPMGACGGTIRIRVSVTASKTFSMLRAFPGIPASVTISRTAIMRAQ